MNLLPVFSLPPSPASSLCPPSFGSTGNGSPPKTAVDDLVALRRLLQEGPAVLSRSQVLAACAEVQFPSSTMADALVLGGFQHQADIPWRRVVALCAAGLRPVCEPHVSAIWPFCLLASPGLLRV